MPHVPLAPDHAPEAAQDVALVDDQVSTEDSPLLIAVGLAASDTVGNGDDTTSTVGPTGDLPLQAATASVTTRLAIRYCVE